MPKCDRIFSPGTTVNVSASDLAFDGTPGTITQVELFDNEISIGFENTVPYSFSYIPANGLHEIVARATDTDGAVGSSVSVGFSVINQTPVITAANLPALTQSYSDVPLTVGSTLSNDPENDPLDYIYQWQSSINQFSFTDIPAAPSSSFTMGLPKTRCSRPMTSIPRTVAW